MRKSEPTLEFEIPSNLLNLPIMDYTTSVVQDKIIVRRKRVHELYCQGLTNKQIAEKIGFSLSTIEKDLCAIKENSRKWYEEDSIIDYCDSIYDRITRCDNAIENLQILYHKEVQIDKKLKILFAIPEYEIRKTKLYEKTRAVQNYLRRSQ